MTMERTCSSRDLAPGGGAQFIHSFNRLSGACYVPGTVLEYIVESKMTKFPALMEHAF